jgi:hypothetical protein
MKNNMQFTDADTFLDKNVFSIVMEIPNSALGSSSKVGVWYKVLIPKDGNPFFQIDRMGRPFINVAFTREEDKDTFNRIEPIRDRELFAKKFVEVLESFGHDHGSAQKTALSLLPDILDYDYSSSEGYPNGRKLTDDVMDFQLNVLTNGRITTDKVGPHQDLFQYFHIWVHHIQSKSKHSSTTHYIHIKSISFQSIKDLYRTQPCMILSRMYLYCKVEVL